MLFFRMVMSGDLHRFPMKNYSLRQLRDMDAPIFYPKELENREDHPHTDIIHSYLALKANPFDLFSFRVVAEHLKLSPVTIQNMRAWAAVKRISYTEAYEKKSGVALDLDCFNREFDPTIVAWINGNLEDHNGDIVDYLRWYAHQDLQVHQENDADAEGKITALSIHQAKGLEWPVVILIGASEGILPSKMARTPDEIEEERRLYYVAATRAKELLIVSPRPDGEVTRFLA